VKEDVQEKKPLVYTYRTVAKDFERYWLKGEFQANPFKSEFLGTQEGKLAKRKLLDGFGKDVSEDSALLKNFNS
jgi:hypothetical protein